MVVRWVSTYYGIGRYAQYLLIVFIVYLEVSLIFGVPYMPDEYIDLSPKWRRQIFNFKYCNGFEIMLLPFSPSLLLLCIHQHLSALNPLIHTDWSN